MVNCKSGFVLKLDSSAVGMLGPSPSVHMHGASHFVCQKAGVCESNYFNNQTVMFTLLAWLFRVKLVQRNEMHSLNV